MTKKQLKLPFKDGRPCKWVKDVHDEERDNYEFDECLEIHGFVRGCSSAVMILRPAELIVIDRFYPSSKTCSRCGWKNKDLKLSDRTFVCKDCGLEIDRDLNAAINIQAVGVDAAIRTQSSRVASCVEASKME